MGILSDKRKQRICLSCEHVGFATVSDGKGSAVVSIILWLLGVVGGVGGAIAAFVVFGFIGAVIAFFLPLLLPMAYSSYANGTKDLICSACGNGEIVPIDTPRGQKLLRKLRSEQDD